MSAYFNVETCGVANQLAPEQSADYSGQSRPRIFVPRSGGVSKRAFWILPAYRLAARFRPFKICRAFCSNSIKFLEAAGRGSVNVTITQ